MTVVEDKLKFERKKVKAQSEMLNKTLRMLNSLSFKYEKRLEKMKPDSYGYKKLSEHKQEVDAIREQMRQDYYKFKKELREKKQRPLQSFD